MSTPQVHTFGIAKYVYASAYDKLEYEHVAALETIKELESRQNGGTDGDDCQDCEQYEKTILRLEVDNAKLRETLREAVPVMENSMSCYTEGSTHDNAWDYARGCLRSQGQSAARRRGMSKLLCAAEFPVVLDNGNSGRGNKWFSSAKGRKEIEAKLRALGHERTPFDVLVTVHVTRMIGAGKRKWDSSSIGRGNYKEIEDALVVVGWFHDDSPKYIDETRFFQDDTDRSGGDRVVIEVYEARKGGKV